MIQVIPAIDIINGKCVRLFQGDFSKTKVYSDSPLDIAKKFEEHGITRLHMVDLDGAKNGKISNLNTLKTISTATNLKIDFGGGIRTEEDVTAVFEAGAKQINLGSLLIKSPDKVFSWVEKYGADRILLGIDVYEDKIAINGWQTKTSIELLPFLKDLATSGHIKEIFITDISNDGAMQGVNLQLYKKILDHLPELKLIASGGVSNIQDILKLAAIGCSGVILGKAIYEGKITLEELRCLQSA